MKRPVYKRDSVCIFRSVSHKSSQMFRHLDVLQCSCNISCQIGFVFRSLQEFQFSDVNQICQ